MNQGSGYTSPPDLTIIGSGTGAVLTPIIENGFLRDINVISGGFGFTQEEALKLSTEVNKLAVDLASFTNFSGGAEGEFGFDKSITRKSKDPT